MTDQFNVAVVPAQYQPALAKLGQALSAHFGADLLGLSAFGGWTVNDPLFQHAPGKSVVVLAKVDLTALDRLAAQGLQLGQQGLAAPLMLTPDYLVSSCDTFPLELLEIQQLHRLVYGRDYFAELKFEPRCVRLQCERDLKSELLSQRQGLLAAAGKRKLLAPLCLASAGRHLRILRGLLFIQGEPAPQLGGDLAGRVGSKLGLKLSTLEAIVRGAQVAELPVFEQFHAETRALADYVDRRPDEPAQAP
jgi:hypothetical protein